jgi:site-specific recombinase XerD
MTTKVLQPDCCCPTKGRRLPPEPLTGSEVRQLIEACPRDTAIGIRNRALIVLMYRTGLRVSEALALMPKDFDAEVGTIRVLNGKSSKSRVVGVDPGAWNALNTWLVLRTTLSISSQVKTFCTLKGQPMKSSYVRKLLPRLARKAGIEKREHAHGLRHTHAFELANEGVPLHIIQAQLGHRSLATTDRYIRHLNPTALVRAIQGRKWDG